jgi:hypothetical protein
MRVPFFLFSFRSVKERRLSSSALKIDRMQTTGDKKSMLSIALPKVLLYTSTITHETLNKSCLHPPNLHFGCWEWHKMEITGSLETLFVATIPYNGNFVNCRFSSPHNTFMTSRRLLFHSSLERRSSDSTLVQHTNDA